jgi:hypothetical protein
MASGSDPEVPAGPAVDGRLNQRNMVTEINHSVPGYASAASVPMITGDLSRNHGAA